MGIDQEPFRFGRILTRSTLCLSLTIALGACVTGVIDQDAQPCPEPLQGSRYSLCGTLTSSGIAQPSGGTSVVGTVGAVHGRTSSSEYSLQGGTFHGSR